MTWQRSPSPSRFFSSTFQPTNNLSTSLATTDTLSIHLQTTDDISISQFRSCLKTSTTTTTLVLSPLQQHLRACHSAPLIFLDISTWPYRSITAIHRTCLCPDIPLSRSIKMPRNFSVPNIKMPRSIQIAQATLSPKAMTPPIYPHLRLLRTCL
jgi:hypothetical protein